MNSKYPAEALETLSLLWNDLDGHQKQIEDFDWQRVLEENNLLDEDEKNHYLFRKERLHQLSVEQREEEEQK